MLLQILNRYVILIAVSVTLTVFLVDSQLNAKTLYQTAKFPSLEKRQRSKSVITTATYYSAKFNGRKTASGERFHEDRNTAATDILPLGSRASVTNLRNGRKTEVVVNDRKPRKRRGRATIDLSKRAAEQIGITRKVGTAPVRVDELARATRGGE